MKELTRAEEQIMQILWEIEQGVVLDVLKQFPEPKPAYNTVSTIIRILEKKGFVGHHQSGKSHIYYPKISKKDYSRHSLKQLVKGYFNNSFNQMVSFFANDSNLKIQDLEEIQTLIEKELKNKKGHD